MNNCQFAKYYSKESSERHSELIPYTKIEPIYGKNAKL